MALLGFPGGVVVPLADARLEAAPAVVHIEERGSEDCPRAHVHGDCVLCQHVAHRQAVVGGAAALQPASGTFQARFPAPDFGVDARTAVPRRGRSPPFD